MTNLRRIVLAFTLIAIGWTIVVILTGGFRFYVGPLRISATSPLNSSILAIVSAAAAWVLATPAERRSAASTVWAHMRGECGLIRMASDHAVRTASTGAAALAAAVIAFGLSRGSFVAGGADEYGYVSQADLWVDGRLVIEQPFGTDMRWSNAASTLAPLGYRPYHAAPLSTDIVPIYAPGLPMVMAAFKRVAGPPAVFYVVPLLGGLAVWATYLMGVRFAGPLVGLCAAALLATSPALLFEVVAPTSDAPVTAWWALAFALLLLERPTAALGAGIATGMAILTRPNLVPLAAVPGLLLLWRAVRRRPATQGADRSAPGAGAFIARSSVHQLLLFALGSIPACLLVAAINEILYGSPLASGYPPFHTLYRWGHLWPNLANYPRWIVEAQTPIVLLAGVAPMLTSRVAFTTGSARDHRAVSVMWLGVILVVLISYLFYVPFDHAGYLRFMLPAFSPLLVLTSLVFVTILKRLAGGMQGVTTAALVALLAWHGLDSAVDRGLLGWRSEERYLTVGDYIAAKLPPRAVFLSMQHSGSVRYYSGRLTVRYDLIAPAELDTVVSGLGRLGYHPYFVLDAPEQAQFRKRFQGASVLGALDWVPIALFHDDSVRIYDPADRQTGRPDLQRIPDVVR